MKMWVSVFAVLALLIGAALSADLADRQTFGFLKSCPTNVKSKSDFNIKLVRCTNMYHSLDYKHHF